MRVIQHCTEHNRTAFAFGTGFGHHSMYDSSGPVVASERPIDRPPGIPEHVKEREKYVRAERPFGELVPAAGTVNGRQLAFGSISRNPRRGLTP